MSARENKLQTDIARFLRGKGCYVLVVSPQSGIPQGCPDILFFYEGFFGALEVKKENPYKKDGTARIGAFEPLQEKTIEKLNEWSYARVVWPEVWPEVHAELERML
jgi:Holliday junction resolvase